MLRPSRAYLRHLVFSGGLAGEAGLASSLAATYLAHATLPLQATPAEQDALLFPLLWTPPEYDPGREEKDFFLRRAFSRKAKDAPRQGTTVIRKGDMINRTWLDRGWDSGAHS